RIPITLTYLREEPTQTGFITVPLAPGVYRFAFEPTLGDRLSFPLGLLGLFVCVALFVADRRERGMLRLRRVRAGAGRAFDRRSEPRFARARLVVLCAGTSVLLAVGIGLGLWRPKLVPQELGNI